MAMEEMRQKEANQTALEAIGPRKKLKLDTQSGSQSTISQVEPDSFKIKKQYVLYTWICS